MSLSQEALANARYRLNQMAREIDGDPSISAIRIMVTVNPKNRRVRSVVVHLEREYEPAPDGIVLREALDNR